ncbi:hypothetical protein BGZ92_001447 [Podila epicladia]|nr:hypothetical protein BGZ92_001447 [Podila epicladia]
MNTLDMLKQYSTVVADMGDFLLLKHYQPQDATTNPSLILKAVTQSEYRPLLTKVVQDHYGQATDKILDHLLVAFGQEILSIIPGRVSTEIDARLSFDTAATIAKAHTLIALYEKLGIARERVLIKIASTWEGIRAADLLERDGIRCNMTLLFSLPQAMVCAAAKVSVISPFVGRIYDWYKQKEGACWDEQANSGAQDPGVQLVRQIYTYYKKFGYATEIMAASFRSFAQIAALAGCDLLTISPSLLQELKNSTQTIERALSPSAAQKEGETIECVNLDEPSFRYQLNSNAMATEKLAEGIRLFSADTVQLETLIKGAVAMA